MISRLVFGVSLLLAAGLFAWLAWGPVLSFFLSLIPPSAAHAWVGNLVCILIVAWGGGVAIPLLCLVSGIFCLWSAQLNDSRRS